MSLIYFQICVANQVMTPIRWELLLECLMFFNTKVKETLTEFAKQIDRGPVRIFVNVLVMTCMDR